MSDRRKRGLGAVDQLPSGKWRARMFVDGGRVGLGTYDDKEEAERTLAAAIVEVGERDPSRLTSMTTLRAFRERWLDDRERRGIKDATNERSRLVHLDDAPFLDWPITSIAQNDIRVYLEELAKKPVRLTRFGSRSKPRKISASTIRGVRSVLHRMLASAVKDGIIPVNPVTAVKLDLPRSVGDPWTYLACGEQEVLTTSTIVPYPYRVMIRVAIYTGIRESEMWTLHIDDVHLDHVEPHLMIRYGGRKAGKYTPPKNGKVRRAPLNPMAIEAMREWMEYLPKHAKTNPFGLVFPTARGGHHRMKKPPRGWLDWLEKLKIRGVTGAPVVWHSLRHTCASMLVSGEWGRAWTLTEVQVQLGHRSAESTERYAHLAPSAVARAAAETLGHVKVISLASARKHSGWSRSPRPRAASLC